MWCGKRTFGLFAGALEGFIPYLSTEWPYRAESRAAEAGLKRTPDDPLRMVPERLSFRVSLGVVPSALGQLQVCRAIQLIGVFS